MAKFTAIFDVKDRMSRKLNAITGNANRLDQSTNKVRHSVERMSASMGKVAVAGAATMGAAMAATAAYSTKAFLDFERGMNEVFTLLPGLSKEAMHEMQQDVKNFSKEFGVLPDEVVPALYQSISAGVPKDNVFEFLEVANKAAIGGVTSLETAVDGITSVVNAYGDDVVDAAKASDLMFTAVKVGKTDFNELSSSLYNVLPNAAAAGVAFEDVAAGVASLAAQGVPTSVATTRIRSAIDELNKSGTKTSDLFNRLTGKSFRQFIADGGNLQQAFQVLENHAEKTGLQIGDLFSSIEAGGAATALTGKGTEFFTDALEEMANSAGATEEAFDTMNRGIGPVIKMLRAHIRVAALDLAEKFAPSVERMAKSLIDNLPAIQNSVEGAFNTIGSVVGFATDYIFPPFIKAISWSKDNMDILKPALIAMASVIMILLVPALIAAAGAGWAAVAPWLPLIAVLLGVGAVVAGVAYLWKEYGDTIKDFVTKAINKAIDIFNALEAGLKVTAAVLTIIFGPALLLTGTRAVVAGAQIAGSYMLSIIKTGTAATIAAGKITASFVVALIRSGIEAMKTGAIITANLIFALYTYAVAGWRTTMAIAAQTAAWLVQRGALIVSTAVTWAMVAAQWALNSAFLANPITWVVVGIIALIAAGVALYKNWDAIKTQASEVWSTLKDMAGQFFEPFIDWIDTATSKFSGLVDMVKNTKFGLPKFLGGDGLVQIPQFAKGTNFAPGGLSLVGEEGPELVNLPRGSGVVPKDKTETILKNASGNKSNNVVNKKSLLLEKLIGEVHVYNEADENRLIKKIRKLLEEELFSGGEGVYE